MIRSVLLKHRILNTSKTYKYANFIHVKQRNHFLSWSKEHLIDPIYAIAQHTISNPMQFGIAVASAALVTVGLRKVSRSVMYIPHTEFCASWKSDLKYVEYKDIYFKNTDNIELHGWYIKGDNEQLSKYPLLFLHGNAGNISHRIDNLLLLNRNIGCDIFIFDYRAYGKSSKQLKPTQNGLIDDSLSALKELIKMHEGKGKESIKPIIFGRSIGAAVGFHMLTLIKQHNIEVGGFIVENTFTKVWDVVPNILLYPFIVDKWNNVACVKGMKEQCLEHIPILFISALMDTILNPEMMKTLQQCCEIKYGFENVYWKEFKDADHNDTFESIGYTEAIKSFIETVKGIDDTDK